jgi:hypothetical protein
MNILMCILAVGAVGLGVKVGFALRPRETSWGRASGRGPSGLALP